LIFKSVIDNSNVGDVTIPGSDLNRTLAKITEGKPFDANVTPFQDVPAPGAFSGENRRFTWIIAVCDWAALCTRDFLQDILVVSAASNVDGITGSYGTVAGSVTDGVPGCG